MCGGVWLHAVSVGEVLSALPLLQAWRQAEPSVPLYLSCSTVSGRAVAMERAGALVDLVFYAPFDFSGSVRRVLRRLRPGALVVLETELWPVLFQEVKRAGCGLVLVNGRISDRAWPRYQRFTWLFRETMRQPDCILAQTETDGQRFRELGATAEQVQVNGNLKYDFLPGRVAPDLAAFVGQIPAVWLAASTVEPTFEGDIDEDDAVLKAWRIVAQEQPETLLIIAPRKPERFAVVAAKIAQQGWPVVRRSALPAKPMALPSILLLDTLGELGALFQYATVVFVGGSLAQRGGHNLLEPAIHGKPILTGQYTDNFREIAERLVGQGGAEIVSESTLASAVLRHLRDGDAAFRMGQAAARTAEQYRGATARAVEAIRSQLLPGPLVQPLGWVKRQMARFLGLFWQTGMQVDRWAKQRRQIRLLTPVLSVGGIAAGGVGKTPMVAWLAERLGGQDKNVAVLTRGYGRRSHKALLLAPGETAEVEETGDEPQLFLRSGRAHVAISTARAQFAQKLERERQFALFLLDDGFQHWRLARQCDIVLLAACDALAGGFLLPMGRLREKVVALRRADIIVLTGAEQAGPLMSLKRWVGQVAPGVPVFTACTSVSAWEQAGRGKQTQPPSLPLYAVCGIGRPASFQQLLAQQGCVVKGSYAYADHQHYDEKLAQHIQRAARHAGAEGIVTTEKDAVKLQGLVREMPLWTPCLQLIIEQEDELLQLIRHHLHSQAR